MKTFKKAFIVETSELEGRLDPIYNLYIQKYIYNTNLPITKLSKLLMSKPQYGANEASIEYESGDVRYIRITDIDKFGLLKENSKRSCQNIEKQYKVEYEDLLFARSGATVGKCYLHQDNTNAIFAGYLIRFKVNKNLIYPKFLFYYTQLNNYINWIKAIQRITAQPNINSEEYKNLLIPLPPLEIQNKIIKIMDNAYKIKKANDQKAKELLDSVDKYLLNELSITLPKEEKRVSFQVDVSDIEGRLDPFYYKKEFLELDKKISNIPHVKFKKIIFLIQNGEDTRNYKENGIKYLKVSNIKPFDLKLDNVVYIDKSSNKVDIEQGDILLTRKGTYGVSHYIKQVPDFSISSEIFCLKTRDINNQYLDIFLNSSIGQKVFFRIKTGGVMGHITQNVIKDIKIPLPPLETQQEIANHIQALREEAKQLQQEAKEVLASAKDEVEAIILK